MTARASTRRQGPLNQICDAGPRQSNLDLKPKALWPCRGTSSREALA